MVARSPAPVCPRNGDVRHSHARGWIGTSAPRLSIGETEKAALDRRPHFQSGVFGYRCRPASEDEPIRGYSKAFPLQHLPQKRRERLPLALGAAYSLKQRSGSSSSLPRVQGLCTSFSFSAPSTPQARGSPSIKSPRRRVSLTNTARKPSGEARLRAQTWPSCCCRSRCASARRPPSPPQPRGRRSARPVHGAPGSFCGRLSVVQKFFGRLRELCGTLMSPMRPLTLILIRCPGCFLRVVFMPVSEDADFGIKPRKYWTV